MKSTSSLIISQLVRLHGEGGLSPTAKEWDELLELGRQAPIRVANLLEFHESVSGADGTVSGREAYAAYLAATAPAFQRAGGRLVTRSDIALGFGLDADARWDMWVVTEYPSGEALAAMWLDPEFVVAHRHRRDGVKRSLALFGPARNSR